MHWSKPIRLILFAFLEVLCWTSWFRSPALGRTSDYLPLYIWLGAMLVWCIAFFKMERFLAKVGLSSVLAILLLGLLCVSR